LGQTPPATGLEQVFKRTHAVGVPFTAPQALPPDATAKLTQLGLTTVARLSQMAPRNRSQIPGSPPQAVPAGWSVSQVLLVLLQLRFPPHGALSLQGIPTSPGATHFLLAQTRPLTQPSSFVQLPLAMDCGAQVPQFPSVISQCALMHCRPAPHPSPLRRVPGFV
jgi:hypothetical protein